MERDTKIISGPDILGKYHELRALGYTTLWTGEGQICMRAPKTPVVYECGICGCYHPWGWNGDCRDNANRFGSPEEYAAKINADAAIVEVRSMDERVEADRNGEENR